jgi:dTDP-4-dehydrorhamnose 3,5-epimerase
MASDNFDGKPPIGNVDGVHVWKMPTYPDSRGRLFKASTAINKEFSPVPFETFEHFFTESKKQVFRGMHFQGSPHSVAKIISIVCGKATDFLFDMRKDSLTFGNLQIVELDEKTPASIFVPEGVAHGYIALAEKTIISYRMNGPFCGNCDGGFSGEIVAEFLPMLLSDTIRSPRDCDLIEFPDYRYATKCDHLL